MNELVWQVTQQAPSINTLVSTRIDESDYSELEQAIEAVVTKATRYFHDNVRDESRYLLITIDNQTHTMSLVVTDDSKTHDSPIIVNAQFTQIASDIDFELLLRETLAEAIMMSHEFMNYSLLAAYTTTNRQQTRLL